jgi:hypothetical protein
LVFIDVTFIRANQGYGSPGLRSKKRARISDLSELGISNHTMSKTMITEIILNLSVIGRSKTTMSKEINTIIIFRFNEIV